MQRLNSTSFWNNFRRGPWPEATIARLQQSLQQLSFELQVVPGIVGLLLFGSYSRGDYGRKSDVDLLVVVADTVMSSTLRAQVIEVTLRVESDNHLPMHFAPLVASAHAPAELGADLLHGVWSDGLILFGQASELASLLPSGLEPWVVLRFSAKRLSASRKVQLSRILHGRTREQHGLIQPPGRLLGPGSAILPVAQAKSLEALLDDLGVTYDAISIWRSVG